MDFDDIDKLIKERQENLQESRFQLGYGIILVFTVLLVSILLWEDYYIYSISLSAGMVIGIILRYSRLCFASAFREPYVTGNTSVMRAVILGLIVSTIGFGIIQLRHNPILGDYDKIPGIVMPVGLNVIIGGFIFGIGMVIAGGCVTGLLMRIGEGHSIFLLVIIGFLLGNSIPTGNMEGKVIYFPDYLDLEVVIIIQVIFLLILYRLALVYEKKKDN
ncbi:MAG: YeeE/YedE family protein [Epulopiscium sp.]|nr:YeeE/YedE family protein [Candidatus Epulonipiscium sp.]